MKWHAPLLKHKVYENHGVLDLAVLKSKETDYLISQVRVSLSRLITQKISGLNEELAMITLKPELEQLLQNTIHNSNGHEVSFEPGMVDKIQQSLTEFAAQQQAKQELAVLVVQPGIRSILARFVRNISSNLHVLSYQAIPDNKQIRRLAADSR